MVIEPCTCPEFFGIHHSHLYDWRPDAGQGDGNWPVDSGWVQVWVDWKTVARAVLIDR